MSDEHAREPSAAPPRPPRRMLAFGGLGLVALGVGRLLYDALSLQRSVHAWLPLVAGAIALLAAAIWLALDTPVPEGLVRPPPASARGRGLAIAAVLGLVALQALIPLRYYLGDDAYDERFSWRMFSAVRVHDCRMQAYDEVSGGARPVQLMRLVQVGWVTTMQRNREAVLERYLRWRCARDDAPDAARVENACVSPEGRRTRLVWRLDCAGDEVTREDVDEPNDGAIEEATGVRGGGR